MNKFVRALLVIQLCLSVLSSLADAATLKSPNNGLNEIGENAFSNGTNNSEINISRQSISVLTNYTLKNMENVSFLNLSENNITEVNRDVFVNLPSLEKLFLNQNNIKILHDNAFEHLISIQDLRLDENQISVITNVSFYGLKALTSLDLRNNSILMIGDEIFVETPKLVKLDLGNNQITYISKNAFNGLRNLKALSLKKNKLVRLTPGLLSGATSIDYLDLSDNELETLTFDDVKPIYDNLLNSPTSRLYLDRNKLRCNPDFKWIVYLYSKVKADPKKQYTLATITCDIVIKIPTIFQIEETEENQTQLHSIALDEEKSRDDPIHVLGSITVTKMFDSTFNRHEPRPEDNSMLPAICYRPISCKNLVYRYNQRIRWDVLKENTDVGSSTTIGPEQLSNN